MAVRNTGSGLRPSTATRARLNAVAAAGELVAGELIWVSNEERMVQATSAEAWREVAHTGQIPAFATIAEAIAGEVSDKIMSPAGVAGAIRSISATYEKFTTSGSFVKSADDVLYFAHVVAGSGGGAGEGTGSGANNAKNGADGGQSSFGGVLYVEGGKGGTVDRLAGGGGGSGGIGSNGGRGGSSLLKDCGLGGASGGAGHAGNRWASSNGGNGRGGLGSTNYRGWVIVTPSSLGASSPVVVGAGGVGGEPHNTTSPNSYGENGDPGFVEVWRLKA